MVIVVQSATRAAGWIGAALPNAPSIKYYNAAIADADKAIAAATQLAAAGEGSVVRALSLGELASLGLEPGEVKPA